jgi:hypothetical protein
MVDDSARLGAELEDEFEWRFGVSPETMRSRLVRRFGLPAGLLVLGALGMADEPRPDVNRQFPVRERTNLSPPIVDWPIHDCARAVHVRSALGHAEVRVIANGSETVGKDRLWVGSGDVQLTRSLKINDVITAVQTVEGVDSLPSIQPVTVTAFPPGGLGRPEVATDIWGCGAVVPVGKLTPSTTVKVFEDGSFVGQGSSTGDWLPVMTQALVAGRGVTAQQVACEEDATRRIEGPLSTPAVPVKAAPNPPPPPSVYPPTVVPGKDTVDLFDLFVGAEAIVRDRGTVVSAPGLFATATANWWPIFPAPVATSKIDAAQKLCSTSAFSTPVDPTTELWTPELAEPICKGQQFVVVRRTMLGAGLVVSANGSPVGYSGGTGGDAVLGVGRPLRDSPQDNVTVHQYYGSLLTTSNTVAVVGGINRPVVGIDGGDPFFIAERGEEQIDGPVFPRGRGPGPRFRIQTCCRSRVRAQVLGHDGAVVAEPPLKEIFPGYFEATWNWQSTSGWAVPGGIPLGPYALRVTTDCGQERAEARFYVIADPAEVGGPPRFSFDETAVWFYSPPNQTVALTYALHPDDARIFSRAIQAAKGHTSTLQAATRIAAAEAAMFSYSVTKSDVDTLQLLQDTEAQCADDAGMLVALLRAVGIPAHPVTADAADETGNMDWSFDTWTEFLAPGAAAPEWRAVHTHWPSNSTVEGPLPRNAFGTTVGVAKERSNDIVLMAGPGWAWNEVNKQTAVTIARNSCGQPNQFLSARPWVEDLCENNYWNPAQHWGCPGTGTRSLSLSLGGDVRMDHRARTATGSVTVTNGRAERLRGRFTLRLVARRPEIKSLQGRILDSRPLDLSLAPGRGRRERFAFHLSEPVRPGELLSLHLTEGEHVRATVAVPLQSAIAVEADREQDLALDGQGELAVTLSNVSSRPVHAIEVRVQGPPQVRVATKESYHREVLAPGESDTIRFVVAGIAPLDAGALTISVATADGGAVEHLVPVRVRGTDLPRDPLRPRLERRE